MATIDFSELNQIAAIYERQAEDCVRSIEIFYDEITELARRTAYEPLVRFTNQIYMFYKEDLREHLQREFSRWNDSEYSFHALAKSIGAGDLAVQKGRRYMDEIEACLTQMFRRGPNQVHVDTMEPHVKDSDFEKFSSAIMVCVKACTQANENAMSEMNRMGADNDTVSCLGGFVKSMGLSITESFQGMITEVEDGLGIFRTGVRTTVEQVPNEGRTVDKRISWTKGISFL